MPDHERQEPASSWHRWTTAASDDPPAGGLFRPLDRDEVDDAELDDAELAPDDDESSELAPPSSMLPSIAGRVDALDGQLRAINVRLDVLGSTVDALRAAVSERIDAYAELAASATRQADDALEEHRRATQRTTADLRKGIAHHEEAVRRVAGLVEEVASDVGSLLDAVADLAPRAIATTGAVDLTPIEATLEVIAAGIDAIPAAPDLRVVEAAIDDLGARIEARLDTMPVSPAAPGAAPSGPPAAAAEVDLEPLTKAIADLRSLVEVVVDTMPASGEGTGADLADRVAEAVVARLDIDELSRQVAERLRQHFEVVTEDEAP